MISINLLPVREWKKREAVRRQVSIFILSFILLLVGLLAVGFTIQGKVSAQKKELKQLEARKARLAYVDKKINQAKKKSKEIETKFKAIEKLQQGRTSTVKILDEVVTCLPIDRLWLKNLDLQGSVLKLSGIALDNHTVALFMQRLDASPLTKKVKLINTRRQKIQGHDLMQFDLTVELAQ
ncbi:MAG: PilN domain-containing protein [Thermodesulfobacteria bacterium]|nr:PilN domain-containing protein [Thermodesulfobacteriota bacterium]